MKKTFLFLFIACCNFSLIAQVSFTNRSDLIGTYNDHSEVAVDMNGDHLDDYTRISSTGVGIDYQQPDGTYTSVFYPMTIENVPDWSVAAGDLDSNGYNDLVMGNNSRVSFLMANSDGTGFTEQTHPEYIFSQRSTMADIDNDGDLDSFVCHDVDLSHPYRNDGTGTMTLDQSLILTIDMPGNYAAIWVDYDNDGDTDMYLTKCRGGSQPGDPARDNAMYTNNGSGSFFENAQDINMKDNAQSWATVFEDFDNDGDFDAFIVNHDFQNRLMENDGTGVFTDVIASSGINPTDLGAWENQAADFDNDGFVDIFSELSRELYMNNGDMTFTGIDLNFDEGAIGDLNNDGFLDVVHNGNLYLHNGNPNNWIKVALEGVDSNLNGIGARVKIYGDWGVQMREIRSGQGFRHMNSLTAHFGIGTSSDIDTIEIYWPSGTVDVIENPDINTMMVVEEGSSPLSVKDLQNLAITVYPNPTSNTLSFSDTSLENSAVTLLDVNGKTIAKKVITNAKVDVSALPSGVYFVQLTSEAKTSNIKFIKN